MIQIGTILVGPRDILSSEEWRRFQEEIEARRQSPEGQRYLEGKKKWCEEHDIPFNGWGG